MKTTEADFDESEYLHLAIQAANQGQHTDALALLKRGSEKFPKNGPLHYMLGAEYAQIGLYEKAENELMAAIQHAPELHMACFQLGLLQLTMGKAVEASVSWKSLDQLPQQHALYLFKHGLEAMAKDAFAEAESLIEQGIAANNFNLQLNGDMQALLQRVKDAQTPTEGTTEQTHSETVNHSWLNAYKTPEQSN